MGATILKLAEVPQALLHEVIHYRCDPNLAASQLDYYVVS
jgi:hypothetical protein